MRLNVILACVYMTETSNQKSSDAMSSSITLQSLNNNIAMSFYDIVSLCFYQEQERKEEEERIRTENLLRGTPLLNQQQNSSFQIKRRSEERSVHDRVLDA